MWVPRFIKRKPKFFIASLPGNHEFQAVAHGQLDLHSETWVFIKNWAEVAIQKNRTKNDGDLAEKETWILRGRNRQLKDLLGLAKEKERAAING